MSEETVVYPPDVAEMLARRDVHGLMARLLQVCHNDRASAAVLHALVSLGRAAVPSLLEALHSQETQLVERVVTSLQQIKDDRVISPLVDLLVRLARGDFFSVLAEQSLRMAVERALVAQGASAVEALLPLCSHPLEDVRQMAAAVLAEIGDARALDALILALQDVDWYVREQAALGLGRIGDACAANALIAALQDRDPLVRRAAIKALGEIAPEESLERLALMLQDSSPPVRLAAAQALSTVEDPVIIDALVNALEAENGEILLLVIRALTKLHAPQAVDALVRNLQHSDNQIRQAAADALAAMGWQPATDVERFWYALARHDWAEWKPLVSL